VGVFGAIASGIIDRLEESVPFKQNLKGRSEQK